MLWDEHKTVNLILLADQTIIICFVVKVSTSKLMGQIGIKPAGM